MVAKLLALVFLAQVLTTSTLTTKNLGGIWKLSDFEGKYKELTATVPGGIYTDLKENNVIGDIFYEDNDMKTRWVANKTWKYTKEFIVTNEILQQENIYLVFEGLDTFSDIYLNDELIGATNNMFVKYEFDVKNNIKVSDNNLTVVLKSPIQISKELFDKQSMNYTVFPACVPKEYNGECHVNHIRKMQASFAWDWGPAFPSVGIWQNVYIQAYNATAIKDVTVDIKDSDNLWKFTVTTYFAKNKKEVLQGTLVLTIFTDIERSENIYSLNLTKENEEFLCNQTVTFAKQHFTTWYPNGMGLQPLYVVKVTYISSDNKEQSNKRIKVGVRTLELVQDENKSGRDFFFKVNGIPFFAKGTNVIPSHILPELTKDETKIRFLLQSCKDVHMNMIRVWGGGIYESDLFYQIADEMGILIWQDFMFACSMYPTNKDYLKSVEEEVKQQVRRLQHHPSIALWAGNNENEAALRGNWYGTFQHFDLYKDDYVKLYIDTIKTTVLKNDDTRTYLTSSPTNGIKSDEEGYVAQDPYSPYYGDVHFYNYIIDSWDQNVNPITRFASEYGYQSLPSAKSILTATNDIKNLNINSDFMKHRQHHPLGYAEIQHLIDIRLKLPDRNSLNFDKAFIFYSQIIQAMAIKLQTEFYRQWQNYIDSAGRGTTMGALYWQLNDVWIAPSWSGIDFNNNWKMLHYYAKEFFAPVIVTFHLLENRNVNVYVISDLPRTLTVTLDISIYLWNGFDRLGSGQEIILNLSPGSQKVASFSLDEFFKRTSECADEYEKNCFLGASFRNYPAPGNILMPANLKHTALKPADVKIQSVNSTKEKEFKILLQTNNKAAFVWLDCDIPGRFSENGFFLLTPSKEVLFFSDNPTTNFQILTHTTVTHLLDSQYL